VDVDSGETRVSVYAGEAALDDGHRQVRLAAGERTFARWGGEAEEPSRFDPAEDDDFARWDGMRESQDRWAANSTEHLPDELGAYAGEFESNGNWRYEGGAGGYVWFPQVPAGWQPYSNGYWAWTPYGWTWIPYESWGWAPFHYGRWDFSASFGWYWMPGRHWGPGWVDWAVGGGYVGWCPLGRHDRPVSPWGYHASAGRGGFGGPDAWHLVRQPQLGGRDLRRHLVNAGQVDTGTIRVADSVLLRPTRDAKGLSQERAVPRTISRRLTPGDFVRELGTDNKTTIPAPWTRGYGPPPAGVEGARYGTPRRTDGTSEDKPSRGWVTGTGTGSGTGSAAERRRGATTTTGTGGGSATTTNPSGSTASPRDGTSRSGDRPQSGTVYRPRPEGSGGQEGSSGSGGSAPRYVPRDSGSSERSGGDRPRGTSGGSSAGSQPRSESGGGSHPRPGTSGASGGSQPRGSGGSSSSGGAHARPSGGSSGSGSSKPSSGSSHSSSRPRG
jgi:hypothetical protein